MVTLSEPDPMTRPAVCSTSVPIANYNPIRYVQHSCTRLHFPSIILVLTFPLQIPEPVCGITSVAFSVSGRLLFAGYDDFECKVSPKYPHTKIDPVQTDITPGLGCSSRRACRHLARTRQPSQLSRREQRCAQSLHRVLGLHGTSESLLHLAIGGLLDTVAHLGIIAAVPQDTIYPPLLA